MIKAIILFAIGYVICYLDHKRKWQNEMDMLEFLIIKTKRELKYWQARNGNKADGM